VDRWNAGKAPDAGADPGPDGDTPAFPRDDPLPSACERHLPADDVIIWYTARAMHR
jgi:hypothetical protein